MDVDLLFDQAVDLFNRGYFFEAHDVWEEIWQEERGEARDFFKGLIHVAAGFHHHSNGNWRGAAALLSSGIAYLEAYAPSRMGIDLEHLLERVRGERDKVVRLRDGVSRAEDVEPPKIARAGQ